MQAVLTQLNSLPGVVGSLVCTREGRVLAQVFPAVFDPGAIDEAARTLVDGATALSLGSEKDDQLDLRFRDVRLLAKPFAAQWLAVLSGRTTNLQMLILAMKAAIARIDKLEAAPPTAPPPASGPRAAEPADTEPRLEASPRPKPRVAAPASGLEELRRRLATKPEKPSEQSPSGSGPPTRP
jgi:predicted regulator of Ras-like GTPase activity (Roadblock/LC7/MglB family)